MKTALAGIGLAVLIVLLSVLPCQAGKNAGGALIVHTNDAYSFSSGTACTTAYGQPASCEDALTRTDKSTGTVIWLLAAFDSTATPSVSGIYFGIDYDDENLDPGTWMLCSSAGATEIPDAGWPYEGRGNSIAFAAPLEGERIFPFYVFKVDGGTDSSYFGTGINPTGGHASFIDDSFPPEEDEITRFGTVRWYQEGTNNCPEALRGFESEVIPPVRYQIPEEIEDGFVLIIGRASRQAELSQWAQFAHLFCDFPSSYKTVEEIRSTYPWITDDATAIQHHIRQVFAGKNALYSYVLLVGDWSHRTESYYAQFREVPTWYVDVGTTLSGSDGLAATDQPYGDLDADGLWDIPVFRVMTRAAQEYYAFRDKAVNYRNLVYIGTEDSWVHDVHIGCDNHSEDGGQQHLPMLAQELTEALPTYTGYDDVRVYSADLTPLQRPTVLPTALSQGYGLLVAGPSSASPPTAWLCFSNQSFRFADSSPSGKPPVVLGLSCHLGAFDYYYNPEDSKPAICRDMFRVEDWRQGPIAWIGPTRGTFQFVDYWLLQGMLDCLLSKGHTPGQALLVATRLLSQSHPEAAYLFKTFCGFGIPWLPLPEGTGYVGIKEPSSPLVWDSMAYPNPMGATGVLHIELQGARGQRAGVEIYDVAGRSVARRTVPITDGVIDVDLKNAGLAPGVYFVQVGCQNGDSVTRIVIVK